MNAPVREVGAPVVFHGGKVTLHPGDCVAVLATLADNSIDAVVTDPPYHLTSIINRFGAENAAPAKVGQTGAFARASRGFMGKQWDGGDIAFTPELWVEVLRVLKPGGHMVAFSGTRTYHRMACAIEDAGFEIRDQLAYCYGSGFPKSHNVSRNLDGSRCSCERVSTKSEHNLHPLREWHVSTPSHAGEGDREILLSRLSEQSASVTGRQELSSASRSAKPGLEGRGNLPQAEGQLRSGQIRPVPGSSSPDGKSGRLCDGASLSDGAMGRASTDADRVCASQGSQAAEQFSEQSGTLAGQPEPQERGAWDHCERCGKPIIPDGLGSAIKPAWEPICLARKPLSEPNIAANVLKWGTGAINVDATRVPHTTVGTGNLALNPHLRKTIKSGPTYNPSNIKTGESNIEPSPLGRFPANLIHDGSPEVLAGFPQTGEGRFPERQTSHDATSFSVARGNIAPTRQMADSGSAARFFYTAKAGKDDRITRFVESVKVEWISESGPCQVSLPVDTEPSRGRDIVVSESTESSGWNTFLSGSNITALCRMASKCIIETETNSTTTLQTWRWLTRLLTSASIPVASYETESGSSHAENVAQLNPSLIIILDETVSLPGANRALSHTPLKISVSGKQHSHPTVKPVDLIQWLVRLVCPKGGVCLDPFAGTGTTGAAAFIEGCRAILIEREAEYQADIARRMELLLSGPDERARKLTVAASTDGLPLFGVPA